MPLILNVVGDYADGEDRNHSNSDHNLLETWRLFEWQVSVHFDSSSPMYEPHIPVIAAMQGVVSACKRVLICMCAHAGNTISTYSFFLDVQWDRGGPTALP